MKDAGLNDVELILWPSAIMHLPLATQIDIAAAGQFNGIAIAPVTIKRELATGLNIADLLSQADDLGISSAVAVGAFDEGTVPLDELVDCYAKFCDAAKTHRIDVHLEFIPLWGIRELPMAWEIVKTADRGSSGIVVDTWHLQQGSSNFERDLSLLETIPGRYLRDVQLADANLIEAGHSLMDEIMLRQFPGDCVVDNSRILSLVAKAGGLRSVGPEVVGVALEGLSQEQIGDRSGATTRGAISRARDIAQLP